MIGVRDLKIVSRPTSELKTFAARGTFKSLYAAQAWCDLNGYSYASLCGNGPIGLLKGDWNIARWKNLTQKEKAGCHGVMLSTDFRDGMVTIKIFKQ